MVYTGIPIGIQSSHERSSAPIFFSIFDDKRSTSVVTTINFSSSFSTSSFDFSSFMACCLTPHRGTEKSQRQLTATCLNKGIAIQFLTLPHLPPPSFKGAPRFIECRRLILWHKQSTRCEVSSFTSCFIVHLTHSVWSLYNATAMLVPVGDPPKLFSRRILSSNIRHEKLLGKFGGKKENRHEKGKIVHLSIHFISFVNDLIFKNLEGYFRR